MQKQIIQGYKLSPQQEHLWQLQNGSPQSHYKVMCAVAIEGELRREILKNGLAGIVNRHEILRTSLRTLPGMTIPLQVISRDASTALHEIDLTRFDSNEQQTRINALWEEIKNQRFELEQEAPLQAYLAAKAPCDHTLILALPALCADPMTLRNIVRELALSYQAAIRCEEFTATPIQYIVVSEWQNELLESEETKFGRDFWSKNDIRDAQGVRLPFEKYPSSADEFAPAFFSLTTDSDIVEIIEALAKVYNTSFSAILFSCWQSLLWRLTGNPNIFIGVAFDGRASEELEEALGLFAKHLPVASNMEEGLRFCDLLKRSEASLMESYEWQDCFSWRNCQALNFDASKPFFTPMNFSYADEDTQYSSSSLSIWIEKEYACIDRYKLKLSCLRAADALTLEFHYDRGALNEEAVIVFADQYRTLLTSAISRPEALLSELELLSDWERQRVLVEFNRTERAYADERCLHTMVEQQAQRTPDATAATSEQDRITYADLDDRANRLANYLSRMGVGPEDLIGICAERNINMIVSVLGALKSGAAYVPLDPAYPRDRLSWMINDAKIRALITQREIMSRLAIETVKVVCIDSDWEEISKEDNQRFDSGVTADNIAYVIYTSGSTGKPKAAMNIHRGVCNRQLWMQETYPLRETDRVLQLSSFSFDFSVWEIFAPLSVGAQLVLPKAGEHRDSAYLADLIAKEGITVVHFVPPMLQMFLEEEAAHSCKSLKRVFCGGDALPAELQNRFFSYLDAELHNQYGPTEASIDVTYWDCKRGDDQKTVPIGRPNANNQVYLLDPQSNLVGIGIAGELRIGGISLGRGYLNRAELTAEKFTPDAFSASAGQRLYRTGDLARYSPDGVIEFLGRIDNQVKVRGFRIELGEIEAVLSEHSSVREAVVVATADADAQTRLIAYVVLTLEGKTDGPQLRSYLRDKLPEYMVPAAIMVLEQMPLTANGKIDRNALPAEIEWARTQRDILIAAKTPTEEILTAIWANILGIKEIGRQENFFDLGGHSLLAAKVISRIRGVFKVELPLRSVFEKATIKDMAAYIDEEVKAGQDLSLKPIERVSRDQKLPLSYAQQRLWFIDQLGPGNANYNTSAAIRITGQLDADALERTLSEIIRRHEILRTTFDVINAEPVQIINPPVALNLLVEDLSSLDPQPREAQALSLARSEATAPFDLRSGPLLRLRLLRLAPGEHVVLFTTHHIISDGWSTGVLVREVAALYDAFIHGRPSPLDELQIQYADYSLWQRNWLQGDELSKLLQYWRRQLDNAPALLDLPTDRPRSAARSYKGASLSLRIDEQLTSRLKQLSRSHSVTLYMTLLAAYKVLLMKRSNQQDIVVGADIANRNRAEIEGLIGFFVNMLVMRTDLSGEPSFRELLARVREMTLGAYAHQEMPFGKLVEQMQPDRSLSHTPLFQVTFVLQNAPGGELNLPGLSLGTLDLATEVSQFDLTLMIAESEAGLIASFKYSTELFDEASISAMAEQYRRVLEGLAADANQAISEVRLLSQQQEHELSVEWNRTCSPYPQDKCIHELFEQQVEKSPKKVALISGEEEISYEELNRRADNLAGHLRRMGVRAGMIVGLCMDRCVEMIVGLMGILKAGGAYVPLDPAYPLRRLSAMVEDSQIAVLVTMSKWSERVPAYWGQVVCLDTDEIQTAQQQSKAAVRAEDLAYVIYTSGSTGRPKGVKIQHRALVNYVWWARQSYAQEEGSDFGLHTSLGFDLTVTTIYTPLISGNAIVVYERAESASVLEEIMRENRVRVLKLTPSHLVMIKGRDNRGSGIRRLIVGGEALESGLAKEVKESFGGKVEIINEYGPTEATVGCMIYRYREVDEGRSSVPIGRPTANMRIYVLDEKGRVAAENVTGEIHISGDGLAQGYVNMEEETRERFVEGRYEQGGRMYRSGDLGRMLRSGEVEYIGRKDEQVKYHGYRVELNEIRSALNEHSEIRESVVVMRKDKQGAENLIGYYASRKEIEAGELREMLKEKIIKETIPNIFVHMRKLPLTLNGKVNAEALPGVEESRARGRKKQEGARNEQEKEVVRIWEEVLGVKGIGVGENFFEIGGHSLLAVQVISRIRKEIGVEIELQEMFERGTVEKMSKRIEEKKREGSRSEVIKRISREGRLPVSYAQQRLWIIDQMEERSAAYNIPAAVRMKGELDVEALGRTISEVIRRHEVLRTVFEMEEGEPVQVIKPAEQLSLQIEDLSWMQEEQREEQAQSMAEEEASRGYDLRTGPLLRVRLLKLGDTDHVVLLTMHHIISDGWSIGVLVREVAELYGAYSRGEESPLEELEIQYADYAVWQREWLQGEQLEKQMSYWRKQLQEAPSVLELPTDHPRPAAQTYRGASESLWIDEEMTGGLKQLSRSQSVTLYMTLLAAYKVLLYRYADQEDVIVGMPIANRNRAEIEGLIGFFVNTLVVRTNLSGEPSFRELLARVREVTLGAYANQDMPFEKLVEEMQPERSLSYSPLFQVTFVMQNAPNEELEMEGIEVRGIGVKSESAKYDIGMAVSEREGKLIGAVEYNKDLYEAETIRRMVEQYKRILRAVVERADERITEIEMLSEQEQHQLLVEWNNSQGSYDTSDCIHELFQQQVERTPHSVAVICGQNQLTFAKLNSKANRLAHYLISIGVGPEVRVGLCLDRSADLIIGLLGILKAGGAYVPLDPNYPQQRLALMLNDSQSQVLLTQQSFIDLLPGFAGETVCLDFQSAAAQSAADTNLDIAVAPQNLAYVIYTSGSTGTPKGVAIQHRNAVAMINWAQMQFTTDELSRMLAATSICFDLSVFEIFVPLSRGGAVLVVENALQMIQDKRIEPSQINTVPSAIAELMRAEAIQQSAETISLAGEPLSRRVVEGLYDLGTIRRIYNLYGPTETTTYSTYTQVSRNEEGQPTIGRPIENTRIYVLDRSGQIVPVGVAGELSISGAGLSRGYLNNPDLTAEKFLPEPFSGQSGERTYRTGDLVRYRKDGDLEFLGRMDQQVKIRGYRIELNEIEAALSQHPGVKECVVDAREEESANRRLVAYVVEQESTPGQEQHITPAEVKLYLKQRLPEYMVPAAVVKLNSMPLTANGKVDRKKLRATDVSREERREYLPMSTPVEQILVEIWSEVLGLDQVSAGDNFFELGGHSLLATRAISRINAIFDRPVALREIFDKPTVRELAQHIEREIKGEEIRAPKIIRADRSRNIPLSYAQQRLWFIEQMRPGAAAYNIPSAVRMKGELDVEALGRAISEVIRRHEVLRTVFEMEEGEPVQVIKPAEQLSLRIEDLSWMQEEQREEQAQRMAGEEASRGYDLRTGPLLRVRLLKLADTDHVALLTMHHIISDGWSIGVLVREVAGLYGAYSRGEESPLEELEIQYADYAVWQREWLQGEQLEKQMSYWRKQLQEAPSVLELPTDHPRPAAQTYRGASESLWIDEEMTGRLKQLSRSQSVTLYMTLLAAFQTLLYRYTQQADILVGTPIAGRSHTQTEALMGFFVNTLIMRADMSGNPSFRALLSRAREMALNAYAHQDMPFEKLVEELQPERSLSHSPLIQVTFSLEQTASEILETPGLKLSAMDVEIGTSQFDLTLFMTESSQGIKGALAYSTDLFETATIVRMKTHLERLLSSIVADPDACLDELQMLSEEESALLEESVEIEDLSRSFSF